MVGLFHRTGPVRIYFDMDGVLADFDGGVRELCCRTPLGQGQAPRAEVDAQWEAIRAVPHFYDRLSPIEGSVEMFRSLHDEYGNTCQILTGIPKKWRGILTAGEDKIRWAQRVLAPDVIVNVVYREQKPRYCRGKSDILVDDYDRNLRAWQRRGGTGVLFVTPEQTLKEVRWKAASLQ